LGSNHLAVSYKALGPARASIQCIVPGLFCFGAVTACPLACTPRSTLGWSQEHFLSFFLSVDLVKARHPSLMESEFQYCFFYSFFLSFFLQSVSSDLMKAKNSSWMQIEFQCYFFLSFFLSFFRSFFLSTW